MARTIDEVVTDARDLLSDTRAGNYRHSDVKIINAFNNALGEALRIRPDLFLAQNFVAPEYSTADLGQNPATAFPIDDQYYTALVQFAVGWIAMADDEFTLDGRAVVFVNAFRAKLLGVELK